MANKKTPALSSVYSAADIVRDCSDPDQETHEKARTLRKRLIAEYDAKHHAGTLTEAEAIEANTLVDSLTPAPQPPKRTRYGKDA